jgi:glycosyltransferase involved in cell wall biosynthesis
VIISDDGSTDNTLEVILNMSDPRIKLVGKEGGLGVIKNFERALRNAQGDIIFLSDQDDVWLDGKVEKSLEALERALMVVTDCKVVNKELEVFSESFFEQRASGPGFLKNLLKNSYLGCCMAFKRELLEVALPIPSNIGMHDIWLGNIAAVTGRVHFLNEPYVLYRRHGNNHSETAESSTNSLLKKLELRFGLLWAITGRLFVVKLNQLTKN